MAARNASYQEARAAKEAETKLLTDADGNMGAASVLVMLQSDAEREEWEKNLDARVKEIKDKIRDVWLLDVQEALRWGGLGAAILVPGAWGLGIALGSSVVSCGISRFTGMTGWECWATDSPPRPWWWA